MSNAAELYARSEQDRDLTRALFSQALQNPDGAIQAICQMGEKMNLPVTDSEVKTYINGLDDELSKQWLIKARGGL